MLKAMFFAVMSWGFAIYAGAAVYHVDASRGSDLNPGTDAEPFKTVRRASEVLEPGDTARIHEGEYHEQIVGGKSGREGAPIVYEGVDPDKVILKGSVLVKDWVRTGTSWIKQGLAPVTPENAFVMVDERRLLKRVDRVEALFPGSFFLSRDGVYVIRLWRDADPNTSHSVEVYEYDFAFNSGDRWNGTAKRWIVLRTMTLEKYGTYAVSTDAHHPQANSHWELDRLKVRYNHAEGIFYCLDDWYVHDCEFVRNGGHGCQLNGARVRFVRNVSSENEWFGPSGDGGCGVLIGPDATAHSCEISYNVFENNGHQSGYGCGVYLEGRSRGNYVHNNLLIGGSAAGVGFYGSSKNLVYDNVLIEIAAGSEWDFAAAFVLHPSIEGAPTEPQANLIERNIVWGCPRPIAVQKRTKEGSPESFNRFVNNVFARCRFESSADAAEAVALESNRWLQCPLEGSNQSTGLGKRLKRSLRKLLNREATIAGERVEGSSVEGKIIPKTTDSQDRAAQ